MPRPWSPPRVEKIAVGSAPAWKSRSQVDDTAGLLGGQLAVGQTATGKYTYDTSVPDQDTDPMYGVYSEGISQALTQISVGSLVFASDAASPNWNYTVTVHPSNMPG